MSRAATRVGNSPAKVEGGYIVYRGSIGPYKAEFQYAEPDFGGSQFRYRYTSIGKWIETKYAGGSGNLEIWREFVNGRNTGTFTIRATRSEIKGTFVNSKGQSFRVSARRVSGDWY